MSRWKRSGPRCVDGERGSTPPEGSGHREHAEREILERVFERVKKTLRVHRPGRRLRRQGAADDCAALLALEPDERLVAVDHGRRFQCVGVAEEAVALARGLLPYDPDEAENLTAMALRVLEHLLRQARAEGGDGDRLEALVYRDTLALAWGVRARALLGRGATHRGREAHHRAYEHLARGSGDPLVAAEVHEQAGLYLLEADDAAGAEAQLRSALEQNQELGEARAGFCLLEHARLRYLLGDAEGALRAQDQGLSLARDARERQRLAAAGIERGLILLDLGRPRPAREALARCRREARSFPALVPHHLWAGGLVLWRLGRPDLAEADLWAALALFEEHRRPREAVRVTLDLLRVHLAQGGGAGVARAARRLERATNAARLPREVKVELFASAELAASGEAEGDAAELAHRLDLLARHLRLPTWRTRTCVH